jgi:membrane-associated phospholipid phosphatase
VLLETCALACGLSQTIAPEAAAATQADAATADAASGHATPLRWDPSWTHAGPWDYALTGVGLTTLLVETAIWQERETPAHWFGPLLFDSAVRDLARGTTTQVRSDAATTSWVLWFAEMGYPLVVDVPLAWARYGKAVAWDLFWQDAVTLSISAAVDITIRDVVGRVRPANYECLVHGGTDCLNGPETTRSFPSGHFSETSTATALICTQHLKMHLYGGIADAVTCASAITADLAVGTLRLVADDHWATDILAGGALGVLLGWGVPTLLHMHGGAGRDTATAGPALEVVPVPLLLDRGGGLGAVGLF